MTRLVDKVAIVAGSGGPLCTTAALALAREGARVFIADLGNDSDETTDSLRELALHAQWVPLDPTSRDSWSSLASHVNERAGKVDVLVMCMTASLCKPLLDTSLEEFQQLNRASAESVFMGMRAILPLMRRSADAPATGSIINVTSILSQHAQSDSAALCGAQAAIRLLSKAVAVECGARRDLIRINSIQVGAIHGSPFESRLGCEHARSKVGTPSDVAEAIVYLASDEARCITGTDLPVGGG